MRTYLRLVSLYLRNHYEGLGSNKAVLNVPGAGNGVGLHGDLKHLGLGGIHRLRGAGMHPILVIHGKVNSHGSGAGNACSRIRGSGVGHKFLQRTDVLQIHGDLEISLRAIIPVGGMEGDEGRVVIGAVHGKLAVGHGGAVLIGVFFQTVIQEQSGMGIFFAQGDIVVALFPFQLGDVFVFIRRTAGGATLDSYAVEVIGGLVNVGPFRFGMNVVFPLLLHRVFVLFDLKGIQHGFVGNTVGGDLKGMVVHLDVGEGDGLLQLEGDMGQLGIAQQIVILRAGGSAAGKVEDALGVGDAGCVALSGIRGEAVDHVCAGVDVLVTRQNHVDVQLLHHGSKLLAAFANGFVDVIIVGAEEVVVGHNHLPAHVGVEGDGLLHKFLMLIPVHVAGVDVQEQNAVVGVPIVSAGFAFAVALPVDGGVGVVEIIFVEIGIVIMVTDGGGHGKGGKLLGG